MKRIEKWLTFWLIAIALAVSAHAETPKEMLSLAVTVESYVYGSERSAPVVTGNAEGGEERYYFRSYSEGSWQEITARPVRDGMPTEGGRYELTVTVGETENYSGGSAACEFYVLPTSLDVGLNAKQSIYFGDGCGEGELFTLDNLLGRSYSVSYAEKGSTAFSSDEPARVGEYTVKVSVAASANYNSTEACADFEIKKRPIGGELALDDAEIVFGSQLSDPPVPEYNGGSETVRAALELLTPTVEYRPFGSSSAFSSAFPTAIGEYEMRVSYAESENLTAAEVSARLRIVKAVISPRVSIEGWVYGETPKSPILSAGSNPGGAEVKYYYKPEGGEFSPELPTRAGKYTVKAVIAESEGYMGGECEAEFTVEAAEREGVTLVFRDWKYGQQPPVPVVSGMLDGADVVFSYSVRGENSYSSTLPTAAGNYTLKAVIAAKGSYRETVLTRDFAIEKADIQISIFVEDWVYGQTVGALAVSGNDGGAKYTLTFYRKTPTGYAVLAENELSGGMPVAAGDYRAVCEVPESENHKGCVASDEFTISKAAPDIILEMPDYSFYSKAPTPSVIGNDGGGEVSFIYYPKGGEISEGSDDITEIVKLPGEYTVTVLVSATDNYRMGVASADFTVNKADLPASSMSLSVKSGGVELERLVYGTEYELSLKNNVGYGAVSFFFETAKGESLPEKPRNAGRYRVRAEIAATEVYKPLSISFEFEIMKVERGELALTFEGFIYGETPPKAVISGNIDGIGERDMTYFYKPYGAGDGEYSENVPTAAGRYTVKLAVSETANYLAAEAVADFSIEKAASVITAGDTVVTYSGAPAQVNATLNHSESELVYSGVAAVDVGEYEVTVSVPESANYTAAEVTVKLTVVKAQGEILGLRMDDREWSGGAVSGPVYSYVGDGVISVEYYREGQRLTGAPADEGEYTVRVTLSEGKNYKGCSSEMSFRIVRGAGGEKNGGWSGWLIAVLLLLAIFAAAVIVAIIVMRKKKGGGPDGFLPGGNPLPPPNTDTDRNGALPHGGEAKEERSVADTANKSVADTDNKSASDTDEKPRKDGKTAENDEKLTDRGRVVLDMWQEGDGETDREETSVDPDVIYKKGGRCAEINLDTLCRHFDSGDVVDMDALVEKGLISKACKRVKLLGRGELTKDLDIRLDSYSRRAMETVKGAK